MTEEFVPAGSPAGWYKHPTENVDYFYTGKGFGTIQGNYVHSPHADGTPTYEPMDPSELTDWLRHGGTAGDAVPGSIPLSRIITLDNLPGHRVLAVLGLVTELTSASGWTAASKGSAALDQALPGLAKQAAARGANAIVGFNATTFGAHGGLTSGFGGDAVGILLMGTAVLVAPTEAAAAAESPAANS
jgi:hypothetical protein